MASVMATDVPAVPVGEAPAADNLPAASLQPGTSSEQGYSHPQAQGDAASPTPAAVNSIDEEIAEGEAAPPLEGRGSKGRSIGSGIRLPSIFHRRSSAARDSRSIYSQDAEDSDDDIYEVEKEPWCNFLRQHCGKGKGGCCYWCYVFVFFSFVYFFALFLKWMLTAPMPLENWHWQFERFPVLMDQAWVQDGSGKDFSIDMSEIPQTWSGCNHSCSKNWNGMISTEMNFNVEMQFSAPEFEHTAYPVLLASNDFNKWWVASDRRDSHPKPYFQSTDDTEAPVYQHITDNCTRPPWEPGADDITTRDNNAPPLTDSAIKQNRFASLPVYVMVCVTWKTESVNWHSNDVNQEMNVDQIAQHCDAVGGVGGWACGSNPLADPLPGVNHDGTIQVQAPTEDGRNFTVAGVEVPGNYSGRVALRACLDWPGDPENKKCKTATTEMSRWPCNKCQVKAVGDNNDIKRTDLYDSLPRMEVLLHDIVLGGAEIGHESVPHAYVLTSPVAEGASGPDGFFNGTWTKLYEATPPTLPKGPMPYLPELEEAQVQVDTLDTTTTQPHPTEVNAARSKMQFYNKNSVTLKPDLCFAARGPLYLVACAVNTSTYQDGFNFVEGQLIAPPPFNDRCLAVTGRCAYACMEQQSPSLDKCAWDTHKIPMNELWDKPDEFEAPVNTGGAVNMFMFVLLLGFAVKLVTYFPGLFIPYKHSKTYVPEMTDELRYIAHCCPSGGETKAVVMRNLVGGISGMPKNCKCHFHLVFADEGHRHPAKIMFRKLVDVMDKVPDISMTTGSNGRRSPRRNRNGYKAENLKTFTKLWTEQTRQSTLAGCETAKIAQKAAKLRKEDAEANKKDIDELEAELDRLSGLKALRTLQTRNGWPKKTDGDEGGNAVGELERALEALRAELAVGEKAIADKSITEAPRPMHMDDVECYKGPLRVFHNEDDSNDGVQGKPLYTMHYLARAKPDEDERTLKVQHVARGVWYYKIPQVDESRTQKTWLEWRQSAQEFVDGDSDNRKYIVPLRTSRGKAGGLNFVENYLFDFSCRQELDEVSRQQTDGQASGEVEPEERYKYSLFAIADARHQFQPDFMQETIPFFFLKKTNKVNPRVAFTQCPQYFPEMPDEVDYLDTNNSNFFRMNCMLRNCCGGVSSCGTGGTWLIRDRRAGIKGTNSIWEMDSIEWRREGFQQIFEHRFFHESCKVEDTASSLDRVVKGKHSQYINRRLAYGMAKDPVDYLAAVQRWAEGGVVLSLQTFMGCEQGIHMIWMTFLLFLSFVASLLVLVYGSYVPLFADISKLLLGSEAIVDGYSSLAGNQADFFIESILWRADVSFARAEWLEVFLEVQLWLTLIFLVVMFIMFVTTVSYMLHHTTCCGRKRKQRRTRFPISMAQWARLAITMDNLTYFLWFWTAFFWVFFNYYTVFFPKTYVFEPNGMMIFSWVVQALSWTMIISATMRYRMDQSMAANEVFFLSLTNIWRTTQLFYITAPLTLYSIIMGFSDFLKNRMLGVDISYWVGGDRGAVSKGITQYWTLLLVTGGITTNILYWAGLTPHAEFINILIVTFIALDVLHPCCFLWLGNTPEKLPKAPEPTQPPCKCMGVEMWNASKRMCQLLGCAAFYRNCVRTVVFHRRTSFFIRWIGPVQNVMFPILTYWMPELAINQALLLLASVK